MITGDEVVFPNNVVNVLAVRFSDIPGLEETTIKKRPLQTSDLSQSLGIYPAMWMPVDDSFEIRGITPGEPTIHRYLVMVQAYIKDGDRERGAAKHSVFAARTRNVLYRDDVLRVALPGLQVNDQGVTESLKRWGVQTQRYFSNELDGAWVYLSSLEFFIETETA